MSDFLKPNILFIILDGLQSDKFYGPKKTSITPNIDLLIKKGVYFDQTISPGSCSVPSVASIMTSLNPFEALIQDDNIYTINDKKPNNIQDFIDNGYTTYALHQEVLNFLGLKKIFDHVETYHDSEKLWNGLGEKIIDFLKSNKLKEPWLYYVQLYDLHLLAYPIKTRLEKGPQQIDNAKFGNNFHDRLVSSMDEWIGKIIENVDLEKTLVVITADHGSENAMYNQEMDEYNDQCVQKREYKPGRVYKLSHKIAMLFPTFLLPLRKKLATIYTKRALEVTYDRMDPELERIEELNLRPFEKRIMKASAKGNPKGLYEERFKVPLLFFGLDIPSNKIINQQARSIDIFPTILDLIKLDNLKHQKYAVSLRPLMHGKFMKESPAFLDGSKNAPKFISHNEIGVRTSDYKYFKNKYHNEDSYLYDLKNDSLEEHNLVKEKPEIVKKMNELLLNFQGNNGFDFEKDVNLFDEEKERHIEEELRRLGYM